MHRIWTLRKIILVVGFALVIFSCATNARQSKLNIVLNAEAVEQGICLTFKNIPPKTTRLFIGFSDWGEIEETTSTHDVISTFVDIRDSSLEQVKNTGIVMLPYVKPEQKYFISAIFEIGEEEHWVNAECTPYSGIYFGDGINLNLNENNTSVTLSSEPVFPIEVQYAPQKYSYSASIDLGSGRSIGVGENKTGKALTWDFTQMPEELKDHLSSGDYPAYIRAYCNIIYDNLSWIIEIAKSDVFIFSM